MSRTQQCSLMAPSLTSHNPGKQLQIGFYFTPALIRLPRRVCLSRIWCYTRADTNQSAEVETSESNEQVLKQTDESRDRRLGGEMEKTSDPLFNEHSRLPRVISRPNFKKQEEKHPTSLVFLVSPSLCFLSHKYTSEVFKQPTGFQAH